MSQVLIVGSTALDSIKTPNAENPRLLGGSASHAAVAASFFAPVRLVGIVGDDFPGKYLSLYRRHGIDLEGLQIKPGKTFHWAGEYEVNMNNRRTLTTELGVFETFSPDLPKAWQNTPFVLLANIGPDLQHHVLDQMKRPKFVVADTMDLWINIQRDELGELLRRIDGLVLNDSEAKLLAEDENLVRAGHAVRAMGPKFVVIKKGEHGAMFFSEHEMYVMPAYPTPHVVDPTGAGDSFAGGMMGHLASLGRFDPQALKESLAYGVITASFTVEDFSLDRLAAIDRGDLDRRVAEYRHMLTF
jgi:sugar/nucleoside kinase (ribokinase family)